VLHIVIQHPHALGALATQHVLRRVDKGRLGTIVIALTDLLGEYQQVFALAVIPGIRGDLLAAHFHPFRHLRQRRQRNALIGPHAGDTGHRHQQSHQHGPQWAAQKLHAIHPSTLAREGLLYRHLSANAEKIVEGRALAWSPRSN